MRSETPSRRVERYQAALGRLTERVAKDREVLAVVLVGSLSESTIWRRESIGLWIIETDGVARRLRSDGNDERIYRILVEDEIDIHAEIIPRSRFKQMVEGSSRTAFSCSFFAERKLVYCVDPSIETWFESARSAATKDRKRELLAFSTWTIHACRRARKRLEIQGDAVLARQEVIWAAHSVAHTEVIRRGQVWEGDAIHRALDGEPELFRVIYLDVLSSEGSDALTTALDAIDAYLETHCEEHLEPLLRLLTKANRTVPLSEISDHFAYTQLYPWHLESACEWLWRQGRLEKLSAPFKLTKRSSESVEEPAYFLDAH